MQNSHTSHSYTSTAVASIIGHASRVCFFPRAFFFFWLGHPMGGIRVGSYMHEGVRVKDETLVQIRATRSMVERSLLLYACQVMTFTPKTGTKHMPVQNNHAQSYTSTVASIIGDASQVFCSSPYRHDGVRAKEETLAYRRAARSRVERSLFLVRLRSPKTGTRQIPVQNNITDHSYTSTAASIIRDASQVCFPRRFPSSAGSPVRVGRACMKGTSKGGNTRTYTNSASR